MEFNESFVRTIYHKKRNEKACKIIELIDPVEEYFHTQKNYEKTFDSNYNKVRRIRLVLFFNCE